MHSLLKATNDLVKVLLGSYKDWNSAVKNKSGYPSILISAYLIRPNVPVTKLGTILLIIP